MSSFFTLGLLGHTTFAQLSTADNLILCMGPWIVASSQEVS